MERSTNGVQFSQLKNINLKKIIEEIEITGILRISDQLINESTVRELSEYLKNHNLIKSIESSNGYMTAQGLGILSQLIQYCHQLTKLSFPNNHITDSDNGFQKFCQALINNISIREINLSNNYLSSNSTYHLSELIKNNNIIENLDLRYNNIGKEGCQLLAQTLESNHSLKHFTLIGNGCDTETIKKIEKLLERNKRSSKSSQENLINIEKSTEFQKTYTNLKNQNKALELKYNDLLKKTEEEKDDIQMSKSLKQIWIESENLRKSQYEQEINKLNGEMVKREEIVSLNLKEQRTKFEEERMKYESLLSEYKQMIESERRKCQELEQIVSRNSRDILQKDQEISQILSESGSKDDLINQLNFKMKEEQDKVEELRKELEQKANESRNLNEIIKVSEDKYSNMVREYESKISLEAQNYTKQNEQRMASELKYQEKKTRLENELNYEIKLKNELLEKINLKEQEIENVNSNLAILKLKSEEEAIRNKDIISKLKNEFEMKTEELNLELRNYQDIEKKMQLEAQKEVNAIQKELIYEVNKREEEYILKFKEFEEKLNTLEKEKSIIEEENSNLKNLIYDTKMERERDIKSLQVSLNEKFDQQLKEMSRELKEKIKNEEEVKESLHKKNLEFLSEIQNLNHMLAEKNVTIEDQHRLQEDISLSKTDLEALRKMYEETKDELNSKNIFIQDLLTRNQNLDLEIKRLTLELNSKSVKNEEVKDIRNQLNIAENDLFQAKNQLMITKNELEKEKNLNIALKNEYEDFYSKQIGNSRVNEFKSLQSIDYNVKNRPNFFIERKDERFPGYIIQNSSPSKNIYPGSFNHK